MRTTLTIDDNIARQLKAIGHRSGKSFKAVVNEAPASRDREQSHCRRGSTLSIGTGRNG